MLKKISYSLAVKFSVTVVFTVILSFVLLFTNSNIGIFGLNKGTEFPLLVSVIDSCDDVNRVFSRVILSGYTSKDKATLELRIAKRKNSRCKEPLIVSVSDLHERLYQNAEVSNEQFTPIEDVEKSYLTMFNVEFFNMLFNQVFVYETSRSDSEVLTLEFPLNTDYIRSGYSEYKFSIFTFFSSDKCSIGEPCEADVRSQVQFQPEIFHLDGFLPEATQIGLVGRELVFSKSGVPAHNGDQAGLLASAIIEIGDSVKSNAIQSTNIFLSILLGVLFSYFFHLVEVLYEQTKQKSSTPRVGSKRRRFARRRSLNTPVGFVRSRDRILK